MFKNIFFTEHLRATDFLSGEKVIFNLLMLYAWQRYDFMLLYTFVSIKNKHSWQIMKANVELNDCLT